MFLSTDRKSRQFVGVFIFCKLCGWRRVDEGGHTSKAHDKWVNNIVPLIHHDHCVLQHIRKLELLIGSIVIIEDAPPAAIAPTAVVVAPQHPGGNIAESAPTAVVVAPQHPGGNIAESAPTAVVIVPQQPGVVSNNVSTGRVVAPRSTHRNRSVPQAPSIEDAIASGIPSVVNVSSQRPIRSNRSEINRYVPQPPAKKKGAKRTRTSLTDINPTNNICGSNDESFDQEDMSESTEENEFE